MKYFKYWTEGTFKISIGDTLEEIKIVTGSNVSKQEAVKEASARAEKIEQRIKRYPILGGDFRVYETSKGIRVIGKKYLDPRDKKYASLMSKLNVDWLYLLLSKKQNCYRARLTPKPYRMNASLEIDNMKIKTIKIKNPLDCEKQSYIDWSKNYARAVEGFSVVRLLKSIGQDFGSDRVIKHHDESCNAYKNNTLA